METIIDPNNMFFLNFYHEIFNFIKTNREYSAMNDQEWVLKDDIAKYLVIILIKSILTSSINSNDLSNLNGYIDRNSVIANFKEYSCIFRFGDCFDSIIKIFKRTLLFIIAENLASSSIEKINPRYAGFKTIVKIKFNIEYNFPIQGRIRPYFSLFKYKKISDDYLIGSSILSIFYIYKKANYQKKINKFNIKYVLKAASIPFKLENELIEDFKTIRTGLFGTYDTTHKLRDVSFSLSNAQYEYQTLISEVKTQINRMLIYKNTLKSGGKYELLNEQVRNDMVTCETFFNFLIKNIKSNINRGDKENLSKKKILNDDIIIKNLTKLIRQLLNNKLKIKNKLKRISDFDKKKKKILDFIYIEYALRFKNDSIFFAYFFDFRGRIYSKSLVHPINNKLARILLTKRRSDPLINKETLINSKFYHLFLSKGKDFIKFQGEDGSYIFSKMNDDFKVFLIKLYLLELGKINKNLFLIKTDKVSLVTFLENGQKNYLMPLNDLETKFNTYEIFEILKYKKAINMVLKDIYHDWTILKDATCSSLQH